MDISLLLCTEPDDQCFLECTTTAAASTDLAFETPEGVKCIYSYGAGFLPGQSLEDVLYDVEMASSLRVDEDDHGQNHCDLPSSVHYHSQASDDGCDDLAVSAPLSHGPDCSSVESDEPPRTPTPDLAILFATQPKVTAAEIEMGAFPLDEEKQGEGCSEQWVSPPYSPRYDPSLEDELDDDTVLMQLVPDNCCSSESEEDKRTPTSTIPTFLGRVTVGSDDDEPIIDLEDPDQGSVGAGSSTDTVAEHNAQFDGDSTDFMQWLDVVVYSKGFVPSCINGLKLSLHDQKTLEQMLSEYRAWRTSTQYPSVPRVETCDLKSNAKSTSPDENPTEDSGEISAIEMSRSPQYAWSESWVANPCLIDEQSFFLARILGKCEADGIELSEALWLFRGRMESLCTRLDELVSAYQCSG